MATLFHSIRDTARAFEYPAVSVAALETILVRLYLETPMNLGVGGQSAMSVIMQSGAAPNALSASAQAAQNAAQACVSGGGRTASDGVAS